MLQNEKFELLLRGPLLGSAKAMPANLISAAMAGLWRVVRANPNCFAAIGLLADASIQKNAPQNTDEEARAVSRGHYKSHPIAVAIAKLSTSPADVGLDHLMGHFVLACLAFDGSDNPELEAAKYSACLALRKIMGLARPDLLVTWLGIDEQLDLEEHRLHLNEWKRNGASEFQAVPGLQRAVEDLERFHAFLAAERKPHPGRERSKKTKENEAIVGLSTQNDPSFSLPPPVAQPRLPPDMPAAVCMAPSNTDVHAIKADTSDAPAFEKARAIISVERVREAAHHSEPAAEGIDQFEVTDTNPSSLLVRPFAFPKQRLPAGHLEVRARRTSAQDLALADPATIRRADIQLLVNTLSTGNHPVTIKAVVAAALYGGQPPNRFLEWSVAQTIDEVDFTKSKSVVVLEPFGLVVPLEATKDLPKALDEMRPTVAPAVFLPFNLKWRGLRALHAHAVNRVGQCLFTTIEIESTESLVKQLHAGQTTALTLRRICGLLPKRIRDVTEGNPPIN